MVSSALLVSLPPPNRFVANDWNPTKRPSGLMWGKMLVPSPSAPSVATDTRTVEGVQPGVPWQVSRTKMSVSELKSPATRLPAKEWKVTKRPSALMAWPLKPTPLPKSPSVPSLATDTRAVAGVQPPTPKQGSRTNTSKAPFVSLPAPTKLSALDAKVTKRPSALMDGSLPARLASVPSVATDTRVVEGVQGPLAPKQVSRTKTSATPLMSLLTRLLAAEAKTTRRPSALSPTRLLTPLPSLPSSASDTRVVEGEHPVGTPAQVSRTKASKAPLVSLPTRLLASDRKATVRPSVPMAGNRLSRLPTVPSVARETIFVEVVQPDPAPRQVSRT